MIGVYLWRCMLRPSRHSRFRPLPFVLASVLLLQTLVSAWASGAMADGPMLDIFGNPLCITSTAHPGGAPADNHSSALNCCTFGCSAVSLFEPSPDTQGALAIHWRYEKIDRRGIDRLIWIQRPDHEPGNARAPPLSI